MHQLIQQLENYTECWKQFNHFVNIARAKNFGPEEEGQFLEVKTVILAGVAANICVLFTANDAYMRDFGLFVPGDCVASNTEEENHYALEQMKRVLKADTRASAELDPGAIARWRPGSKRVTASGRP